MALSSTPKPPATNAGLNLVASYEAFCVKMLCAIRQELIFARQQKEVGRPARWLGFPVIATSHTWENGKNQQSHQDTTFCESLLGEMSDVSRVLFPDDYNSTLEALPGIYLRRGYRPLSHLIGRLPWSSPG